MFLRKVANSLFLSAIAARLGYRTTTPGIELQVTDYGGKEFCVLLLSSANLGQVQDLRPQGSRPKRDGAGRVLFQAS